MSGMRQGIEAELLLWKASYDSQIGGRLIFEVSKDELEPFLGLKTKKDGQRFAAVLVLIGDDEKPVPVPKDAEDIVRDVLNAGTKVHYAKEEPKPRPPATESQREAMNGRCGLAIKWCAEPHFHEWMAFTFPEEWAMVPTNKGKAPSDVDSAAAVLKRVCRVDSRKTLNTDPAASLRFDALIREPYAACRRADGIEAD